MGSTIIAPKGGVGTHRRSNVSAFSVRLATAFKEADLPELGPIFARLFRQVDDHVNDALDNTQFLEGFIDFSNSAALTVPKAKASIRNLASRLFISDPPDIQYIGVVGATLYPVGNWLRISNTTGGGLTLTSTPTIPAGANGQSIKLINISAQTVTVQDSGTLANSGLRLKTGTVAIAQYRVLQLEYSSDIGAWLQSGL